jgi:hypothetical protein
MRVSRRLKLCFCFVPSYETGRRRRVVVERGAALERRVALNAEVVLLVFHARQPLRVARECHAQLYRAGI